MTKLSRYQRVMEIGMNQARRTAPRLATLGAILTLFVTTSAVRGAEPLCSQATMSGTYVTSGTGTLGAGTSGAASVATVGKVTYDGQGNGQVTFTRSVAGVISQKVTATGTYMVNSDCTGSKNFGGPGGTNYDFVVTADGREIVWIVTNAGTVLSGRAVRLDNSRN
jgi:hypothetical protein